MSDLKQELFDKHKKDAEKHAEFLCEKVFKPAFIMGWMHGAKHMHDDIIEGKVNFVTEVKPR